MYTPGKDALHALWQMFLGVGQQWRGRTHTVDAAKQCVQCAT